MWPGFEAERALFRRAVSDPADDAARHIYADGLAEHGEPVRADLLRAERALRAAEFADAAALREALQAIALRCPADWTALVTAGEVSDSVSHAFQEMTGLPNVVAYVELRRCLRSAEDGPAALLARMGRPELQLREPRRVWRGMPSNFRSEVVEVDLLGAFHSILPPGLHQVRARYTSTTHARVSRELDSAYRRVLHDLR